MLSSWASLLALVVGGCLLIFLIFHVGISALHAKLIKI